MFPTSGYFNSIVCPYYASGLCDRPYCHFKHSKNQTNGKFDFLSTSKVKRSSPTKPSYSYNDVPVYHPTPIALLEKRDELNRNAKSSNSNYNTASSSSSGCAPAYSPAITNSSILNKGKISSSNSSSNESSPRKCTLTNTQNNFYDANQLLDEAPHSNESAPLMVDNGLEKHEEDNQPRSSSNSPQKLHSTAYQVNSVYGSPTDNQKMGKVKRKRVKEKSQPSTPIKEKTAKEDTGAKLSKLYSDLFGDDMEEEDCVPQKRIKLCDSEPSGCSEISATKPSISSGKLSDDSKKEMKNVSSRTAVCQSKISNNMTLISNKRNLTPKEIMYNRMIEHRKELLGNVASGSKHQKSANIPSKNPQRPTVPRTCGNKIALVTRQRYLNQFVDECLKLYPDNCNAAYDKALDDEEATYKKSSSHVVYINSAIRIIKSLREKQLASSTNYKSEDTVLAKNTVSHAAVLNRSLSNNCGISNSKTITEEEINRILRGNEFYKSLEKYVLTEDQLVANGYPRPCKESYNSGMAFISTAEEKTKHLAKLKRFCSRCGTEFPVSPTGEILTFSECVYHWGKAWRQRVRGQGVEQRYSCCAGDLTQKGCQVGPSHVHDLNKWTDNRDYIRTLPPESTQHPKCFAIDCEMVYTSNGCELARVTVIDQKLDSVYEKVVRPLYPVIDYNTRFSGITESTIPQDAPILIDVQTDLIKLFNEDSILIGHSLESDLTALKIIHSKVVDTSMVFPHRLGPPKKRALRNIVADVLQKIIQSDTNGHDSREDAVVCMELMQSVVKDDIKKNSRKRQR